MPTTDSARSRRTARIVPDAPRGFSLGDVLIVALLVSIALVPIMGLFPFGRQALKKAENLQTAIFLARQSMSDARAVVAPDLHNPPSDPSIPADHAVVTETVNGVDYVVARDIYSVHAAPDPDDKAKQDVVLMDVVVKVEWPTMQTPLLYSSRVYRKYLDLKKNVTTKKVGPPSL